MQDEPLDSRVAAFLEEIRAAHTSPQAPEAGPELAALFSSGINFDEGNLATGASTPDGAALHRAGSPTPMRGRQVFKKVLGSLAGKATAAVVGGLVAVGGLATAGALPGGMQLTASNIAASVGADIPDGGSNVISANSHTATPTVGVGRGKKVNPGDPLPPPATTAAEAAHIHAFDVACGNHGAYVSHVARFGVEPACAAAVRNGQTPDAAVLGQKGADDSDEVERDGEKSAEEKAARDKAKAERDAAREKAKAERAGAEADDDDAPGAKAEADREAARDKAADREAARDKARAKADRDKAKSERRGGGRGR